VLGKAAIRADHR